ncbi:MULTISPECIES: hypothetical protein [unclassified Kitasatospora]|uniref:hypothetical protein n=1 Tax=unclassified Kitasatospora TaxID=2633591 RepID=UPI0033D59EBC
MDMLQHVGPGAAAEGAGPVGGASAASPATMRAGGGSGGSGRRRPQPGVRSQPDRRRQRGLCYATVHSFTVALLVLLPAAYLTVFELSDGYPGADPVMYLLLVLPLLLLPFAIGTRTSAGHRRAALRWFGRAVAYYVACFLAPLVLLLALASLAFTAALGGTWTSESLLLEGLEYIGLAALLFGGSVVVALFMVAPWAARGLDARPVLAVLANVMPTLVVMIGAIPAVIVIAVHLVFTYRVMPAATLWRRSHPGARAAGQRQADSAPTSGGTGDRP